MTENRANAEDLEPIFAALQEDCDRMIEAWVDQVKVDSDVPSSDEMSDIQLKDSLPEVLRQVLGVASGSADAIQADRFDLAFAEEHGHDRSSHDFDPRELVREYQVLRSIVFRELQEIASDRQLEGTLAVRAGRRLGDALDLALRETIGAFVERETDSWVEKSRRDSLTGLLNHRSFYEELDRQLKASERSQQPFSVALFDLDRFKEINDRLGHRAGDRLITAWAEKLRRVLRQTDIVSRYGGDEFAAILVGSDRRSTEALLASLTQEGVNLTDLSPQGAEKLGRSAVGTSWGASSYPDDGNTSAELIEAADHRLLAVKRRRP